MRGRFCSVQRSSEEPLTSQMNFYPNCLVLSRRCMQNSNTHTHVWMYACIYVCMYACSMTLVWHSFTNYLAIFHAPWITLERVQTSSACIPGGCGCCLGVGSLLSILVRLPTPSCCICTYAWHLYVTESSLTRSRIE